MSPTPPDAPLFAARRRFGPADGERWTGYLAWSGLRQLREVVSLDTMLCPPLPESLVPADWEHNVHADYRTSLFRSVDYLRSRVGGEQRVNLLALLPNPSADEIRRVSLPGFGFAGFDLVDVRGDVSALTNCGGFDRAFAGAELSRLGLLDRLERAYEVREALRTHYPGEHHAECDVWAIWRATAT